MKKVSEWLAELGSHQIYDAAAVAKEFTEETGEQPCWLTHSAAATRKMIEDRGLGGSLSGDCEMASGFEIAEGCAQKFVPGGFHSTKFGRGSRFWECVEALRRADR